MPWLVSMRMIGLVMGARATTATRRSVIFKSDGLELVLTFWGRASRISRPQSPAAAAPAADRRKLRRACTRGFLDTDIAPPENESAFRTRKARYTTVHPPWQV